MGKSIRNLTAVTRVGLDLAKKVFQVHAVDAKGEVVVARKVDARPARRLLRRVGAVRGGDGGLLLGPSLGAAIAGARARGEADPAGACEARMSSAQQERRGRRGGDLRGGIAIRNGSRPAILCRPGQRFVSVRSIDNQAELMRHRARELLAGQRTSLLNALRGHMAEIGVVAAQGAQHAYDLKRLAADGFDDNGEIVVPDCVRAALRPLIGQIDALDEAIGAIDKELAASVKADETARRLMTIPGIGPVTASAIRATIQDMSAFASGREFSAFLGLTPRQSSSGGKERLGRITKMGDRYLRKLLVVGACATLRHRQGHNDALRRWASATLERKAVRYKFKLTAVALANKVARIVFALMTRGGQYDDRPVAA